MLEPDPTYEFATTPKGSGGVRRLFSRPENVALGSYGLEFYSTFKETMAIDGEPADISFKPQGYLFLSDGGDSSRMRSNYETQTANGVGAELLEQGDLKTRFPSVNFDDVEVGVLTPDDAWIDPHAAMMGFRRMARHLGVDYRKDRVVDWQGDGAAARHVIGIGANNFCQDIRSGGRGVVRRNRGDVRLACSIRPMSRQTHYFLCKAEIEPLPFLKCETDLAFRPEGPVLRAVSLIGPSVPVSMELCARLVRERSLAGLGASGTGIGRNPPRADMGLSLRTE